MKYFSEQYKGQRLQFLCRCFYLKICEYSNAGSLEKKFSSGYKLLGMEALKCALLRNFIIVNGRFFIFK